MFFNSGFHASSFLVLVKLSSLFAWVWSFCSTFLEASITFSCLLTWEHPTSKFESKLPRFPEASPALLLSSSFTRLTRDPELCDEISSSHWLCITRLTSLDYAVGEPSFEVVFCPRFDMTPDTVRSVNWERESFLKWPQEYVDKLKMLSKQRKVVPFISWETSVGQNVSELVLGVNIFNLDLGFQNWFCRTTNPEQLCGFWTHVSLLGFVLCTTDFHLGKNACWWARCPHQIFDQPSAFFCQLGSWF